MRRPLAAMPAGHPARPVVSFVSRLTLAAIAALLGAATPAFAQVVNINSSVAVNTTWGPTGTVVGTLFRIQSSISVNAGVTLTIQPGVIVKFESTRSLTVLGTLTADGTPGSNIYFTSIKDDGIGGDTNGDGNATVPGSQDWGQLLFPASSPDNSLLDWCDIRYGGYSNSGILEFQSSSHTVNNCVIRRGYYGIDCQGNAAPNISGTSIEASTQTPIVLDFTAAPVLSSLVFSTANNGYDAFGLRGATLTAPTTLPRRGATVGANPISNVTYVLFGSLTINSGGGLSVDPGVVIKPVSGYNITVNSGGTLTMNGTAAVGDTITVTSIHDDNFGLPGDTNNNGSLTAPAPGNWNRIVFAPGAAGALSRCRLKFGSTSAAQGVVEMTNVSIPVSNSLLSDVAHGLAIFGVSNPVVTNVDINNCTSTPVLMSVSANPTFTNIGLLANAITAIGLNGEPIAVSSSLLQRTLGGFANMTYYVMNGPIQMLSPAILTIQPGIVLKNEMFGGGFVIDGGLIADGTPAQPIVFTSVRDDQYGNPPDTNGDGSITTPTTANWTYIRFTGTSDDANALLDNCRVSYASYGPHDGWNTAVWIQNAAPTISNTFITRATYGIRVEGSSTPVIDACDINNCASAPIVMSTLADPDIRTNCVYSTNGFNAIALLSETLSQNARLRYRPGVGTPTFAYLPTGTITVASGVTLAVDPLVVLKPSSSYVLFQVNGVLNMVGSNGTTGRVVITSRRDDNPNYGGDTTPLDASTPQTGDWGNIAFSDISVDAQCVIRNTLFQFGGAGGQDGGTIFTTSASPRLARNEFFQNVTAMTFGGNSSPVVDSTTILNCTQLPIVFSLISSPQFPHPDLVTLANGAYTALGLLGETIAQDVRLGVRRLSGIANMPYCPTTTITIAFGAKWTIDPGIVLKFGRIFSDPIGVLINIDGALVADGKPDSLIVFTSLADDAFGGDVRGDGALTSPAPSNWYGIEFRGISNDAATVIDHCRFRYGGYWGTGAFRFLSAGPTITNTHVTLFGGTGSSIEGASTPIFTNVQFDSCTNTPVQMSLVSEPVFNNVQFLGNTYTALGVIGESIAQDVLWRIRPVAGRNNMPYLLQGTLTTGLGATVTLQPGLIVKSTSSGTVNIQRAFLAEGRSVTPESLIVFTSHRDDFYGGDTNNDGATTVPAASDWNYITVEGTAIDPQVRFKNCVFRYGGSGTTLGALRAVNSAPTADSCLFAYNAVGISVEGASNPTARGCSFVGNTQFAINNTGNSFCVNTEGSWWGAANGPLDNVATADLCGLGLNAGTGDRVSNNVDYVPYATSGIVNPLLGDVSLNGQVLAYDASLVAQSLVFLIALNPLQISVGDVDGDNLVTGLDATYILQWVAGIISAFPAVNNRAHEVPADRLAARRAALDGPFTVELGEAVRDGDDWLVPVSASGATPIYALELWLEDGSAGSLANLTVTDAGFALREHHVKDGVARAVIAAAEPLTAGVVAHLRFAGAADDWQAPRLAWARANARILDLGSPPVPPIVPAASFLAAPVPNPARDAATLRLGLARAEEVRIRIADLAGRRVRDLHDGPLAAGVHPLAWDLRDAGGQRVPPGLYFLEVRAGSFRATRRLTVVH